MDGLATHRPLSPEAVDDSKGLYAVVTVSDAVAPAERIVYRLVCGRDHNNSDVKDSARGWSVSAASHFHETATRKRQPSFAEGVSFVVFVAGQGSGVHADGESLQIQSRREILRRQNVKRAAAIHFEDRFCAAAIARPLSTFRLSLPTEGRIRLSETHLASRSSSVKGRDTSV